MCEVNKILHKLIGVDNDMAKGLFRPKKIGTKGGPELADSNQPFLAYSDDHYLIISQHILNQEVYNEKPISYSFNKPGEIALVSSPVERMVLCKSRKCAKKKTKYYHILLSEFINITGANSSVNDVLIALYNNRLKQIGALFDMHKNMTAKAILEDLIEKYPGIMEQVPPKFLKSYCKSSSGHFSAIRKELLSTAQ